MTVGQDLPQTYEMQSDMEVISTQFRSDKQLSVNIELVLKRVVRNNPHCRNVFNTIHVSSLILKPAIRIQYPALSTHLYFFDGQRTFFHEFVRESRGV